MREINLKERNIKNDASHMLDIKKKIGNNKWPKALESEN